MSMHKLSSTASEHPGVFYTVLLAFHLFPLHAPLTTFGLIDAPFGRFSQKDSRWNVDGNIAWFCMEIVAPVTFLGTIAISSPTSLSLPTKIAGGLYVAHYAVRAIISPLILAPTRSEQNVIVGLCAAAFNLLNAYLLGSFIASNPLQEQDLYSVRLWLGISGWALGLAGNIYHDEILHDLRRPSKLFKLLGVSTRTEQSKSAGKNISDDQYKIPRGGLFYWIAFPNYTCEWFEWLSYALMLSPYPLLSVRSGVFATLPIPAVLQAVLPDRLLSPPWAFLLAEVTSMLPRAIRGVQWYRQKFGKEWDDSGRKGGRWIALPGL